jgi:hypothetical protein
MNSVVFQPGITWAKLGYALYSNSLAYRKVLDQNPKWSVTETPPLGSVILADYPDSPGMTNQVVPAIGGSSGSVSEEYFPFDNKLRYFESLYRYNTAALEEVERYNGWSLDSEAALTSKP